jgi:hypothetical protein
VPAASHPCVPRHLLHLAPALGLGDPNPAGRTLLDFCPTHGFRVVSQHVDSLLTLGPLSARPTFTRGYCATIVDYIFVPTNDSWTSSAECEVVPHTSIDVHGVGSEHAPVLLPCPPRPPRASACGKRRDTLRARRLCPRPSSWRWPSCTS